MSLNLRLRLRVRLSRVKTAWHLLNLPCREITRLASESMDRDLGRLERLALRSHVVYCRACRRYLRQLLLLRATLRRIARRVESEPAPPLPGPGLPDDVRERLRRLLNGN